MLLYHWICHNQALSDKQRSPGAITSLCSKHETLAQCWFDAGPPLTTLGQHQYGIGSTYRVCWVSRHRFTLTLLVIRSVRPRMIKCWPTVCDAGPTSNQHWNNVSCLLVRSGAQPQHRSKCLPEVSYRSAPDVTSRKHGGLWPWSVIRTDMIIRTHARYDALSDLTKMAAAFGPVLSALCAVCCIIKP